MKIAVFSDSHGYSDNMIRVLQSTPFDMVIHLGDYIRDVQLIQKQFRTIPFEYVAGNGDYFTSSQTTEKTLVIQNKKIFITHGHIQLRRNDYENLKRIGNKTDCDAIFFGHTHIPWNEPVNGKLYLNPGSISFPRSQSGTTFAIVEIADDKLSANIFQC